MKKTVLVLSIMAILAGCDDSSSSSTGLNSQSANTPVVSQEQSQDQANNQDANQEEANNDMALQRHTARIVGEKEGSLYLVEGEGLYGKTDGQHVWTYESQIPYNLTLDRVGFDVEAEFDASIEYYVNIYLMIDGVEHKASIMLNRKDKSEEANVVFYIDDVENKDDRNHKWQYASTAYHWLEEVGAEKDTQGVADSSFASFEAFQAAMKKAQDLGYIGEVIVENQQHRYDYIAPNNTSEPVQGNFYLKFGSSDYAGKDDTFVIKKWEFTVDGVNVTDPNFDEATPVDPEFDQHNPIDPNFGQDAPVDPEFGRPALDDPQFGKDVPVDPNFGQDAPVDPEFGRPALDDPQFGQDVPVDPNFGQDAPVDPEFGRPALDDPQFGQDVPVDPNFGQDALVDPEFGQDAPVDPGFEKPAVDDPNFGQDVPVDPGFEKPAVDDPNFGQDVPVDPGFEKPAVDDPNFGQDTGVDSDFGQEAPVDPSFGQNIKG
ncbi:hypothetical protein N9R79_03710 [Vibrio sp.]|nr:hypothetical protein [Vibrio sp.]